MNREPKPGATTGAGPKMSRAKAIQGLTAQSLDVLIIGGGIVGAGIARDAAMRGLKVGLVEQHDFAFGTSSRSSRLLHGGMRYLAQGRLGLVRQASVEKKIVHKIAPHLAEPLPFLFPVYRGNPHWVLWQLKIGVKIYDLLCGGRNFGASTWLSKKRALQKIPSLAESELKGAVRYYDGFTNDARLVLDTLRSAAKHGAALLNYCRFRNAINQNGWAADVEDLVSGGAWRIRAHAVVNATGPWADGLPHSRVKLRITKGVHMVVERSRLSAPDAVVMTEGARILFVIPWGERTILGTTDTDYQGSLDRVEAEPEAINYILKVANRFFPNARLVPTDVLSSWAGLRPLLADSDGKPSDISRSHQIRSFEPGWWDVAGGKLTTYRLMAEETIDLIVRWLQKQPAAKDHSGVRAHSRTAEEPLLPASETAGVSGLLPPTCDRGIVEHFCRDEWAVHLDDVFVRRTGWHHYLKKRKEVAQQVVDWMGELLGWSSEQKAAELKRYANIP
jgi:glycerol-3-phosphate dehydrogenase